MVTRKTQKMLDLLGKVYGPDIPSYPGSPMEGLILDEAELILHELAHQVQMPKDFVFTPGRMAKEFNDVGTYLDNLPRWRSDRHELRAVAIELVVARRLGLRLTGYEIINNSTANTKLYNNCRYLRERYAKLVARTKKTQFVQRNADIIIEFIHLVEEGKL